MTQPDDKKTLTLNDFNQQIMEPAVKALEQRTGLTRHQIVKKVDRELEPHRRVMGRVRDTFKKGC